MWSDLALFSLFFLNFHITVDQEHYWKLNKKKKSAILAATRCHTRGKVFIFEKSQGTLTINLFFFFAERSLPYMYTKLKLKIIKYFFYFQKWAKQFLICTKET